MQFALLENIPRIEARTRIHKNILPQYEHILLIYTDQ